MARGKIRNRVDNRGPLQRMADNAETAEQQSKLDVVIPEQMAMAKFERAGLAFRRTPVIDTLWDAGKLTEVEYTSLAYYRDQALRAEDDVAGQSVLAPEKIMGGGGGSSPVGGYIPASLIWTPAIAETARIERDLGSLRDITRAVAVEDVSLSQWCVARHGGRERYDGNGKFVAVVPVCEKRHVEMARLELRHAAGRITR